MEGIHLPLAYSACYTVFMDSYEMLAVASIAPQKLLTAQDLYNMPNHGGHTELVRGKLVPMYPEGELTPMSPAGTKQGQVTYDLGFEIGLFVKKHDLGHMYAAETGFTITQNPDTVRAPDIAFVCKERIPSEGKQKGFWVLAPDLVVEVISPFDRVSDVQKKVAEYLMAGVRLVWLVDPQIKTVTVYESLSQALLLSENDTLDGDDVLPGFSLPLSKLFQ